MTDLSDITREYLLNAVRDLLAAIRQQAAGKGMADIVELAEDAEVILAEVLKRKTN